MPGFIAVISLIGHDNLYVSDVDAVAEIASAPQRFPKDLRVYGKWLPFLFFFSSNDVNERGSECLRDKCCYDGGQRMEVPT